ncbi:aminodeoxychorismate synthase component I [Acetoanaerobium sticklandii]|uniref:aminodeoxychorismate synthase component I n=1 Tax=Acetoanaerobium sticklandii TaxID=1511 RepID=UPI003A8EC9D0
MIKEIKKYIEPIEIFELIKDEPHSFILESSLYHDEYGRYSIIASNPFEVVKYSNDPECIDKFRTIMNKYSFVSNNDTKSLLPFNGGAVGYLSYDLGRYIEKIENKTIVDMEVPDLYFGLYDWAYVVDHKERKLYLVSADLDKDKEEKLIIEKEELILNHTPAEKLIPVDEEVQLKSNFTKQEYIDSIEKVRQYIRSGDIYQANLTQRFDGKTKRSAFDIYSELREVGPTIFGGLLNFEDVQVISNSPERFIKVENRKIQTRPIKGTRPRGDNTEQDEFFKTELSNSEKDKAELLMIVDLERNDLGRVSEIGSVKVPELFKIEAYANVYHLVATIESEIDKDKDIYEVIKATFPGGSITGAPKIRAMEVIEELEPTRRNVYTGSIGYIGFDGLADLNIAIRTIVKKDDRITFQVGGGITWDSNPEDEYMETLHKAKSIMKTLRGHIQDDTSK